MNNVKAITLENLRQEITAMRDAGWRFVTISAVDLNENEFELMYHFHDPEFNIQHFRLTVPKGTIIPSISPILFCALLVENEIKDLFHMEFEGLVLDYKGTFYTDVDESSEGEAMSAPFCTFTTVRKNKE